MNKKTLIRLILPLCLVLVASFVKAQPASAAVESISGWAWSDNIGWIKFDTGVSSPVTVDTSTGNWSGYAWSSNVGWLSFNSSDTSYCVSNHGGSVANVNTTSGVVSGWGRFLSAIGHESEGWDGCFELSNPVTHPVTMNMVSGAITANSFAWGGYVVGWTQLDGPNGLVCSNACGYTPPVPAINPVSCSPSSTVSGPAQVNVVFQPLLPVTGGSGTYEYSWNGGSTWSGASTYSYSYGAGNYTRPNPLIPSLVVRNAGDTTSVSAIVASPNCANIVSMGNLSVNIGADPSTASQATVTRKRGNTFGLKWTANLPATYTCSSSVSSNPSGSNWSGSSAWLDRDSADFTANGQTTALNIPSTAPTGKYTFGLSCTDSTGPTFSASTNLIVVFSDVIEI